MAHTSTSKNNYIGRRAARMKSRFSKVIVVFSITTILAYTAVDLMLLVEGYHVPDSLRYCFYGAFSIELSALAGIKVKEKVKHQGFRGNDYFDDIL